MKNFYKIALMVSIATLASGSLNAQTELITDGGFESGAGSGNWVETSTNFGTPLCSIPNCGTGTGTGAHSGNIWAWFGGIQGTVETSSLSQSFVIPSGGTAILTFWLEQILCDSQQDFINVSVDGNVVFVSDGSSSSCGVLGYTLRIVDISTYADGNSHTLSFNSTTFSANGTESNFFVDDVSVISSVGGGGVICADTTTFSNLNLQIPDNDSLGVVDTKVISGLNGTLGIDVQLKSVCFKIDHTWTGDLIVKLIAPNGSQILLTDRPGVPATLSGCSGDNLNVCVNVGLGNEMENICGNLPAISGSFTAANNSDLGDINNAGGSPNGTWQLFVSDNVTDDAGTILEWSLAFDDGPIANWTSPGSLCATASPVILDQYVDGTSGGSWTGTGVTGSSFDPTGLSGSVPVTYTVTDLGTGCTDTETNSIFIDTTSPTVGFNFVSISLSALFNSTSVNASSYLWTFGDGGTSTSENPVHNYASAGTYSVTLTVTNACGSNNLTQTVVVQNCPDILTDGSFEAGPGSGNWTESSTNFSSPICDLNCDPNGISQALTGNFWALFGGTVNFEEGILSQVKTIAISSTATLTFWLQIPICDSPDDFLKVVVDADTLYTVTGGSNLCGTTSYSLQSVNLDAYDDGLPHTITLISRTFGTNGGVSIFFVDDVALNVCTEVGVAENNLDKHIDVMPIPANEFMNINFTDIIASNVKIEIADILGKNIFNSTIQQVIDDQSERIDVSGWSKGIYMLKVTSGSNSVNRKIIIQ